MVFSVFSDTMRYGQFAGGTHPTGMHSCSKFRLRPEAGRYLAAKITEKI